MTKQTNLGDMLASLFKTIETRRGAAPDTSYTASLLAAGPAKCAKKFGEEAVEAAIAGALEDNDALTAEAADALYHLMVLLSSRWRIAGRRGGGTCRASRRVRPCGKSGPQEFLRVWRSFK